MNFFKKIRISVNEHGFGHVTVDGVTLPGVKSVAIKASGGTSPTAVIECVGDIDAEIDVPAENIAKAFAE